MTRDAILELARASGWTEYSVRHAVEVERLVRFAGLVAAAEREAAIEIVNEYTDDDGLCCAADLLSDIRERSEKDAA